MIDWHFERRITAYAGLEDGSKQADGGKQKDE